MPQPRRVLRNQEVDDYPVRPDVQRLDDRDEEKKTRTITILLCASYFSVGFGENMYGLLFPAKGRQIGLNSYICGMVISLSYLICFLCYPLACRMVTSVSYKLSLCISLFMLGCCRVLFGTLNLITESVSFAAVAFAVKAVDGVFLSLLLTSTNLIVSAQPESSSKKNAIAVQISFTAGLTIGPIVAGALKDVIGFDIIFYILGGITVLCFIFTTIFTPNVVQHLRYEEIPVFSWLKNRNMLIYFAITSFSFLSVGFVYTSLESVIRKLTMNSLYAGLIFAVGPFVYSVTSIGWAWACTVGFNGVMLAFIGCLIVIGSEVLYGPASVTGLNMSFQSLCSALLLLGLGMSCKVICCIESAKREKRLDRSRSEVEKCFIDFVAFSLGAVLGFSLGSIAAGFITIRRFVPVLLSVESALAVGMVVFAFSRNYVSMKRTGTQDERQQIVTK